MRGRRFARLAGLVLAAASLGAVAAGAQEAVQLRVHHLLPPQSLAHSKFLTPWAQKVEAESGGRLKVQVFPSMQLGGTPPQLIDQVRDGVVDAVWTLPGYTAGRFPISEVFELPFMVTTAEATSQALWEFAGKHLKQEFASVHPLAFHVHARGVLHTREKPVLTVADMKGLKIRAPTRPVGLLLERLGAAQVGMPVSQLPEALSKGVVDGAVIPWEVALPLRIHELVKHHTEFEGRHGLYGATFVFAMNKRRYEGLPPELKAVIDRNSGAGLAQRTGKLWDEAEEAGRAAAKARGNSVTRISEADAASWRQAAEPVFAAWREDMKKRGLDGEKLHAEAAALIERFTAK